MERVTTLWKVFHNRPDESEIAVEKVSVMAPFLLAYFNYFYKIQISRSYKSFCSHFKNAVKIKKCIT